MALEEIALEGRKGECAWLCAPSALCAADSTSNARQELTGTRSLVCWPSLPVADSDTDSLAAVGSSFPACSHTHNYTQRTTHTHDLQQVAPCPSCGSCWRLDCPWVV